MLKAIDVSTHKTMNQKIQIISKEEFAEISKSNDLKGLANCFVRILFHCALISMAFYLVGQNHPVFAALVLIPHYIAWSFLGWSGLGHELFHKKVFTSRAVNIILFRMLSVLSWSNYAYFETSHMVHHKDPLSEKDFEVIPQARLAGWALIGSLTIDLGSAYRRVSIMVKNAFGVVPNGAAQKFFPQHSEARTNLINGARVVLISHLVFVLFSIYFDLMVLILFITMAPFVLTFPNRILSALQHFNLKSNTESDFFSSTRTIIVNPVTRFFYAGMNYHVEHHLFPTVPFYNLPVLHKRLIELDVLLNFEPSFLSGFRYLYENGYFRPTEGAKETL